MIHILPEESEVFYEDLLLQEEEDSEDFETDTDDCLEEACRGEGILA